MKKIVYQKDDDYLLERIFLILNHLLENQQMQNGTIVQYYDNADLKKILHLSDKTLYRWRKSGILPYVKIGGRIYYQKEVLELLTKYKK